MPKSVSKKQHRLMMAIIHGGYQTDRTPPASVASKYSKPDKDAPESKNNDRGGKWRNKDKDKKKKKKKDEKEETKKTDLSKNILRDGAGGRIHYDMSHGDSLKLVGTGLFRLIRKYTKDMGDEDFKEFNIDAYTVHIRKHLNDIYSGRVVEGQKTIHQFINKSLPMVVADLMSIFEWYDEHDAHVLDTLSDSSIADDEIHGGLKALSDNYHKHNLSDIYKEFEAIRTEIRHNNSIDIQQVEARIMKLFDKLEDSVNNLNVKHNKMCEIANSEIQELENKLKDLQAKIAGVDKPNTVEAYSPYNVNPEKVYNNEYFYLPKPQVIIEPTGRIRITFADQWSDLDKENFLTDMKAKALKSKAK